MLKTFSNTKEKDSFQKKIFFFRMPLKRKGFLKIKSISTSEEKDFYVWEIVFYRTRATISRSWLVFKLKYNFYVLFML